MFVRTLRGAEKVTVMKPNRPAVIYNKTLFRFSTDNNNVCYKGFFYYYYSHLYYITQIQIRIFKLWSAAREEVNVKNKTFVEFTILMSWLFS